MYTYNDDSKSNRNSNTTTANHSNDNNNYAIIKTTRSFARQAACAIFQYLKT